MLWPQLESRRSEEGLTAAGFGRCTSLHVYLLVLGSSKFVVGDVCDGSPDELTHQREAKAHGCGKVREKGFSLWIR